MRIVALGVCCLLALPFVAVAFAVLLLAVAIAPKKHSGRSAFARRLAAVLAIVNAGLARVTPKPASVTPASPDGAVLATPQIIKNGDGKPETQFTPTNGDKQLAMVAECMGRPVNAVNERGVGSLGGFTIGRVQPMPVTSADHLISLLDSFPWKTWAARLQDGIEPIARDVVRITGEKVYDSFTFDDPFTSSFITQYIGERITQLDAFTKENVSAMLRRVFDEQGGGKSTFELAQLVADETRKHVKGYETWRAHRIARTESAYNYNHGTVLGKYQAGFDKVTSTDGDQDDICAQWNGKECTIREALDNSLGHPNCTRTFS